MWNNVHCGAVLQWLPLFWVILSLRWWYHFWRHFWPPRRCAIGDGDCHSYPLWLWLFWALYINVKCHRRENMNLQHVNTNCQGIQSKTHWWDIGEWSFWWWWLWSRGVLVRALLSIVCNPIDWWYCVIIMIRELHHIYFFTNLFAVRPGCGPRSAHLVSVAGLEGSCSFILWSLFYEISSNDMNVGVLSDDHVGDRRFVGGQIRIFCHYENRCCCVVSCFFSIILFVELYVFIGGRRWS